MFNNNNSFKKRNALSWMRTSGSNYVAVVMRLEKAMAPHSSTLAWKIPWTQEPGGLQSMRLLRAGHN